MADEDMQKALVGLHMSEQFVETINNGLQFRAVLFAFLLAFAMNALMALDVDSFNSNGLAVAYAGCLSTSVGFGIFSVIAATMTSAKLSRLLARKQFLFGRIDDIEKEPAAALERLRAFGPHWTETTGTLTRKELESFLLSRTTAVLTRKQPQHYQPIKPLTAHGWIREDYTYYSHPLVRCFALAPLRVLHLATIAFQLSLFGFCSALVIYLTDAMGLALGLLLATPIVLGFVLVLVVLIANGTLLNMDVIWKPALEIGPHRV